VPKNKTEQTVARTSILKNAGVARVLTAVIALPVLIASIVVPRLELVFVLLAVVATALAIYEYYSLALRRDIKPDIVAMYLAAAALLTIAYFNDPGIDLLLVQFVLIILTVSTLVRATLRGAPFDKMIASSGATILGVLYIAWLGSHIISLRTSFTPTLSTHLLSFFFLVLMGSDVGAYYVGRALGKHKLAPTISPGKTWEGVFGGFAAALAMATLSRFWFFSELPLKWGLLLAAVMTVVGILGDLTESALKRSAGAKDAAQLLPGHGGILDRLDSLLFNAPLLYYFARFYFNR
jgi:phosphatidate cytidylyltransferase